MHKQYKIVGGGGNFGCWALFWEQCALFPCFLWHAGLPPPFYGGIGEVRPLIRDGPPPYKDPLHCLLYYWAPHMDPSWALLHHHQILCHDDASSTSTFTLSQSPFPFWADPLPLKGSVALSLALLGLPHIWSLPCLPPLSSLKS